MSVAGTLFGLWAVPVGLVSLLRRA